jgi:hypothetical protein
MLFVVSDSVFGLRWLIGDVNNWGFSSTLMRSTGRVINHYVAQRVCVFKKYYFAVYKILTQTRYAESKLKRIPGL